MPLNMNFVFEYLLENIVLILPIVAVWVLFDFLIKKGWMEKLTGRAYPSEDAVFGKKEESTGKLSERDFVFKTDLFSFIFTQILCLVFVIFLTIITITGTKEDSAIMTLIGPIFSGLLALAIFIIFIQGIFTCVTQIRIVQKGVEFKKFFPLKIITLYPEDVNKIIILIGKDYSKTVGSFTFYLKNEKVLYFSIPYYTPKAIKSVLSQFSNCEQIKEKAGVLVTIKYLIESRFNI